MSIDRHLFHSLVPVQECPWDEAITEAERQALQQVGAGRPIQTKVLGPRFTRPLWLLNEALHRNAGLARRRNYTTWSSVVRHVLACCAASDKPYWHWTPEEWVTNFRVIFKARRNTSAATLLMAYAVGNVPIEIAVLGEDRRRHNREFAQSFFGQAYVDFENLVFQQIKDMGYRPHGQGMEWRHATARLVLHARGVEIRPDHIAFLRQEVARGIRPTTPFFALTAALHQLGMLDESIPKEPYVYASRPSTSPWDLEVDQWFKRQTRMAPNTAKNLRSRMRTIGAWMAKECPHVVTLADVDFDACEKFIHGAIEATFETYGRYSRRPPRQPGRALTANAKLLYISTLRVMISEFSRLGMIPRERRLLLEHLEAPRGLKIERSVNPVRDIDELIYAKLMTAALNLTESEYEAACTGVGGMRHCFEMVKAIAMVWLFSALRNDEIRRLDVECLPERWSYETDDADGEAEVAFLRVPSNKTSPEFEKPVALEVAQAIKAWQAIRPGSQVPLEDRKTRRPTQHLFMVRNRIIGEGYVNGSLIPLLCAVAGVPSSDSRGAITAHRARSTMATLLANSDNPMSLSALQTWLGHKSQRSTQRYVSIKMRTMTRSYRAAVRSTRIEMPGFVDLLGGGFVEADDARSGRIVYSELGDSDGLCGQPAAHTCAHAMACPGCSLHVPENDPLTQRLRRGQDAIRIMQLFDLSPEDARLLRKRQRDEDLAEKLIDTPTPDGRTPREIRREGAA